MKDFIIATVSTADLPKTYLDEHHIPFIRYTYTIDDQLFEDDCTEESKAALFQAMHEKKIPNTSQISQYAYYQFFKELLQQEKDILFVDMSRAISNSIVNCERAIADIKEKYPEARIHFIDSYAITGGLGLLVKDLVRLKENGASFDEVVEWGETHKLEYIHRFMVDDLTWLRHGGRLSNASAIVGTLLSIKPLISVVADGSLVAYDKVHGRKKSLRALIDSCREDLEEYTPGEEIIIIQTDDLEDANHFKEDFIATYPQVKNSPISIITLGPVIASHIGPGFIGIVFRGKKR